MTIQTINLGSYANDGTGDDLRTAFEKVNANFALLESDVTGATNVGAGTGLYAQKTSTNLEFKTLTSTDNSIVLTHTATTVNLQSQARIQNDPMPTVVAPIYNGSILTNPFNLNNNTVINGDVETTVYGYDVPGIASLVQILVESNQLDLDFGGWDNPSSATLDFNGTGNSNFDDSSTSQLSLDFGTF